MKGLCSGGRSPAFAAATRAVWVRLSHEALMRAKAPVMKGRPVARTRANKAALWGWEYSSR